MKFGHFYLERLQDFPVHLREPAVSYRQLKKYLKLVRKELESCGLDRLTVLRLASHASQAERVGGSDATGQEDNADTANEEPGLQYTLADDADTGTIKSRITLELNRAYGPLFNDGLITATKAHLRELAASQRMGDFPEHTNGELGSGPTRRVSILDSDASSEKGSLEESLDLSDGKTKRIEVSLASDADFFQQLKDDISGLGAIQIREREGLITRIGQLIGDMRKTAAPSKWRSDLYAWREIFASYGQANIFYSNREVDHGQHDAVTARRELETLLAHIKEKKILDQFKKKKSLATFHEFIEINDALIKNIEYQELNATAITKILKKFDKTTGLGARKEWPKIIAHEPFFADDMAKAIVLNINAELMPTVPQLDDYKCPVCWDIAWKPLKLDCGHMHCTTCVIKMKGKRDEKCALCRRPTVFLADACHLDKELYKFQKEYFPKEMKQKEKEKRELDMAAYEQRWGEPLPNVYPFNRMANIA